VWYVSLWAKGHSAKDTFPVYCGKCLSRKEVPKWAANVSLMINRLNGDAEVADTTVKTLL
jgi:hypothetical protein